MASVSCILLVTTRSIAPLGVYGCIIIHDTMHCMDTGEAVMISNKIYHFMHDHHRSVAHKGGWACIGVCVLMFDMDTGQPMTTST